MDKIFNWTSTVIGIVGGFFCRSIRQVGQYLVGIVSHYGVGLFNRHYQGDLHENNVK